MVETREERIRGCSCVHEEIMECFKEEETSLLYVCCNPELMRTERLCWLKTDYPNYN